MIFRSLVLAGLLAFGVPSASALADSGDCHTIVIPPGVGIGPGADVTSFNPLFLTSLYNQEASWLLFEQLIWINRFHEIDWSRSIASAIVTPDNGRTYDITLRPWKWSDGVPVTSADVLYTFKLIQDYGSNYTGYGSGGMPMLISSMTAPDAAHVRIVLKHAVNPQWFILNGIAQLQPLPAHVWGRYTPNEIWDGQSDPKFFAVVDGPVKLKTLAIGQYAAFVPNPLYGGAKMHFERFIMKFENSEGQELQAVESGDLDMSNIPFDLYDKASELPGMQVATLPPTYSWHELIPNMANKATPFFADVRVRQAIADAINQNEVIRVAMHGHGVATYNPVPPYPSVFLSPSAKAGQFAVGYDPAQAKALLVEAGFTPGPDGILQKDGKKLSFTLEIPAGQPLRIEIAETVQQELRAIGIDMKVQQVEFNQLMAAMVSLPQSWEAILIAEDMAAYPSGEDLFKTGGYLNNNGYADKAMDKLIDESTDQPGMDGLFAYQDYASAQQPVIFLPNEQYSVLVRNGLHGVQDFMNPLGMWAPEKLYCTAH
ncbi:MAG TPA: peptide ABC transporter substrate-binding protein [Acidocella sp.]|nr:peptide ABC transporter substrate-binding protein [Acidocella sp.]